MDNGYCYCIIRPTPRESDNGNCGLMMDEVISNVDLISDRGVLVSGDIVIISAILPPFSTLSYQVICLPVTTIATHTFIESIFKERQL